MPLCRINSRSFGYQNPFQLTTIITLSMTPVSANASILLADDCQSINQKLLQLTDHEWDVLSFISDGLTTAEIASCLVIEPKSIENYKRRISKKLEISGRSNLIKFCIVNRDYLRKLYSIVHK